MKKPVAIFILLFFIICSFGAYAGQGQRWDTIATTHHLRFSENELIASKTVPSIYHNPFITISPYANNKFHDSVAQSYTSRDIRSIILLFIQSLIVGLLAVFTPYVYTMHPFTVGYLTRNAKSGLEKVINSLIYAVSIIFVFMLLGMLVSLIIKYTGLQKYTDSWIFDLFICRFFAVLGITFLGGFTIKLPKRLINFMAQKAESNNFKGIFFMAVTLPFASASSTVPFMGLVLVFAANASIIGPVVGMCGFGVGLSLPFVFPVIINIVDRSKSMLNNIKVVMGFFSLMLALKFLSKGDVALGWNLIDRGLFIAIWMGIWAIMGVYMLGFVKLSHDLEPEQNIYGQQYIPLLRLFIAITSFVFALYLLPGIWGAPLHGVNSFLPLASQ